MNISKDNNQRCYIIDGTVIFDPNSSDLTVVHRKISLSFTEANTLELMINNCGQVIDKESIKSYSWSGRVVTDSSIVKSVSNLRIALKAASLDDSCILTIPRLGYKFTSNVEVIEKGQDLINDVEVIDVDHIDSKHMNSVKNSFDINDTSIIPNELHSEVAILSNDATKIEPHYFLSVKKLYGTGIVRKLEFFLYFIGALLIPFTIYNFFIKLDINLSDDFISKDFAYANTLPGAQGGGGHFTERN